MKRIIAIDDSRTVRMFLEMSLRQLGYQIDTHSELFEFQPTEDTSPDLVLLDVQMEDFLGTDLIAHIRQNWTGTPLIYLYSQLPEPELEKRAELWKADGYICKSWGFDGLVEKVQTILGHPDEVEI